MKYRRRMSWAEAVKRATVEPKSQQVVNEVAEQLKSEGVPETTIEEFLQNVRILPEDKEEFLN